MQTATNTTTPSRTNRYPAACDNCAARVPAGAGTLSRSPRGAWRVTCPDCVQSAPDAPSERVADALAWSAGNAVSYGVVTSTGWRGYRNRRGRCEDAPCCGCCSF